MFQHTATRRWLPEQNLILFFNKLVSTHSHPKVAALNSRFTDGIKRVSTHSHPKVAARGK